MAAVQGYSKLALVLISAYFVASVTVHVHAQSGFISIDCGSTEAYTDEVTGINYVPDMDYIGSGQNNNITDIIYNDVTLEPHLRTVRSFPNGLRNCYTVRHKVNAVNGTRFLIRARFMYGNYDLKNQIPEFDLYIGVNLWTTIKMDDISSVTTVEMIHLTQSDVTSVCLVNKGSGTPFISVLETRILEYDAYVLAANGSINLVTRANMVSGSNIRYRYPADDYDRIWEPTEWSSGVSYISTNETVAVSVSNYFKPPEVVLSTAVVASTASGINIYQNLDRGEGSDQYYSYFYFAELQNLAANQKREFNINWPGSKFIVRDFSPRYLVSDTYYRAGPDTIMKSYNFSLTETPSSTLAPILNAYEIYMYNSWDLLATNAADIEAMDALKSSYGESKIWQGDPCAPQNYSWEGISCTFKEFDEPIITGLNLSSLNLKGTISFDISKLKSLQNLDLSNNNLSGAVPEFLSSMTSLRFLYLNNNNFSGTLPPTLVRKSSEGSLTLRFQCNPLLFSSNPCNQPRTDFSSGHSASPIVLFAHYGCSSSFHFVIFLIFQCLF